MIAVLEEKAREAAAIPISKIFPEVDFISLRGKMEWPTQGKITSHFGRVLNQELKTWTENTGIDIEATNGAPVKAVASGKVTVVTWLRGYGNTMIISHPNDFYTVYTHLDEVLVNPGSNVKGGTVIATVGDAGARGKPKLHFEIWEKKEKQNPEKWLKKRG
jgi:murein DD-endopeptidase MepM/ murein hydrolase activator NlpD